MKRKRDVLIAVAFLGTLVALAVGDKILEKRVVAEAAGVQVPIFEVDPMWPKPLPNHWILGNTIGVSADAKDNIWIIHRQGSLEQKEIYPLWNPPASECCFPAPPVLAFDQAGNLVQHWGGKAAKVTNGRTPITALRSITKVTSGLEATASAPSRASLLEVAEHGAAERPLRTKATTAEETISRGRMTV